jgi:hypothetical protein
MNSRTNSLQLDENDARQFYPFWLNLHLTSFSKNVISQVLDIRFEQAWWCWKFTKSCFTRFG